MRFALPLVSCPVLVLRTSADSTFSLSSSGSLLLGWLDEVLGEVLVEVLVEVMGEILNEGLEEGLDEAISLRYGLLGHICMEIMIFWAFGL